MAKIRAVIFDIGRVLIRLDSRRLRTLLAEGLPFSPEELWSAIEKDPRWMDWQEGRIAPRDWHLHLTKRFQMPMDFAQFTEVWNSALDPDPIHPNSFFAGLAKRYRLALISNTDPIHVAKLESTYRFFDYFPKNARVYSCVAGASKPQPLVFGEALKAVKVRADEAVYVDDILAYVEAAEKLGMQGIQFQSAEQLRADLAAKGVEVEDSCTA
jgi:glucose-1-phosphatase